MARLLPHVVTTIRALRYGQMEALRVGDVTLYQSQARRIGELLETDAVQHVYGNYQSKADQRRADRDEARARNHSRR